MTTSTTEDLSRLLINKAGELYPAKPKEDRPAKSEKDAEARVISTIKRHMANGLSLRWVSLRNGSELPGKEFSATANRLLGKAGLSVEGSGLLMTFSLLEKKAAK